MLAYAASETRDKNGEYSTLPWSDYDSFSTHPEWNTSSPVPNASVKGSGLVSIPLVTTLGREDAPASFISAEASRLGQGGTSDFPSSTERSLTPPSGTQDLGDCCHSLMGSDILDWNEVSKDAEFVWPSSLFKAKIDLRWTQLRNLMKRKVKNHADMTLGGSTFFWADDGWQQTIPPLNKESQIYHAYAVRTIARLICLLEKRFAQNQDAEAFKHYVPPKLDHQPPEQLLVVENTWGHGSSFTKLWRRLQFYWNELPSAAKRGRVNRQKADQNRRQKRKAETRANSSSFGPPSRSDSLGESRPEITLDEGVGKEWLLEPVKVGEKEEDPFNAFVDYDAPR
jgi:hypothetical protein